MRAVTVTLYKFDELKNEKAKDRAREWWRSATATDTAWGAESLQSVEAFCEHFGVKLKDWSVGAYSPYDFSTDAENHHFRGRKLRDFKRDTMPTGYCLDCSLWVTFYDAFKRTGDAKGAFDAGMHAGFADWRADMESQLEDEYIDDCLIANEYEFTEDGEPV